MSGATRPDVPHHTLLWKEDDRVMAVPADPTVLHSMPEQPRVVLLKPLVTSPLI